MAIWLSSDLHFGHDREFIWKARGYESVRDMNEDLIEKWNKTVGVGDSVYLLGDVMLGNNDEGLKMVKSLKGNIRLVLGNHDTDERVKLYNGCYNIEEISYGEMIRSGGLQLFLSHYPVMIRGLGEEKKRHRLCNLYGHTHQTDRFYSNSDGKFPWMYNVGVDSHDGWPVNVEDVVKEIKAEYEKLEW